MSARYLASGLLLLASSWLGVAEAAAPSALRVGAGKVEVTPAPAELPANYRGVNDAIHARSLVIDDGERRALLITLDIGGVPTPLWQAIADRVQQDYGIPAERLLVTATHTHSVPRNTSPTYVDKVMESVAQAMAALQPARMAYGSGVSYINVNRTMINPETGRWGEGPNYAGPSDKTVAVLAFETPDGAPLAVYYNYAVHGVIAGQLDEVSGDIPGAASRYIEQSLGGDVVALWSLGAAGDQNPVFFQQTYDLRRLRIEDYARRGEDISNTMLPGGTGLDRANPQVAALMDQQRQMLLTLGQMLGEEVLHVLRAGLEQPETAVAVAGVRGSLTCPGRRRLDQGREGAPGSYEPGDPVDLQLGVLRVGSVYLGAVNAEIFNPIATRLKAESPHKHTMMVTLTNGTANSGYVPHDAAFGFHTFEVLSSRLQQGCAENGIVDGLLDLMAAVTDAP
jgi:neutral ceramidase